MSLRNIIFVAKKNAPDFQPGREGSWFCHHSTMSGGHAMPKNMQKAVGAELEMQKKVVEHQRNAAKLTHAEEVRSSARKHPVMMGPTGSCHPAAATRLLCTRLGRR